MNETQFSAMVNLVSHDDLKRFATAIYRHLLCDEHGEYNPADSTAGRSGADFIAAVDHDMTELIKADSVNEPSHWDDHPRFTVNDWQHEVADGNTRQSYTEWLNDRLDDESE